MPNKAFIKLLLSKTQLTSEQIMDLDDADAFGYLDRGVNQ